MSDSTKQVADCIDIAVVFEAQWTNCPESVKDEVRKLWSDNELGNDFYYYSWSPEEDTENYPVIAEYLASRNVDDCLIHFWW